MVGINFEFANLHVKRVNTGIKIVPIRAQFKSSVLKWFHHTGVLQYDPLLLEQGTKNILSVSNELSIQCKCCVGCSCTVKKIYIEFMCDGDNTT